MSDNPWDMKAQEELAERLADSEGFRLGADSNFNGKICLFTKGANEHGFQNNLALEVFDTWRDVICFMAGWNKRSFVMAATKSSGA